MLLRVLRGLTTLSVFTLAAFIAAGIYAFKNGVDPTLVNNWIILPAVGNIILAMLFYVSEQEAEKSQILKKEEARLERLRRFRGQ